MNSRIAAGFLAIFATGLIVPPVETAARGGGFAGGGRAMPAVGGGFRGPIVRPPIMAPRPVAPAVRAAPFARAPIVRAPFARAPFARVPFGRVPFANLRHRRFFSAGLPVSVWGDAPWYSGYTDPSYYPSYYAPPDPAIYSYPATASPAEGVPVRERVIYVMPPRPGCSTQTYHVPAEKGGERSINVVRC